MKSSKLEAAKRIASDQEDTRFTALREASRRLKEGTVDCSLTAQLLEQVESAVTEMGPSVDVWLQDGRDAFLARCVEAYCSAYEAAVEHVLLPWSAWQRWYTGLQTLSPCATDQSSAVAKAREEALRHYETQLLRCFWGCRRAFPMNLRRCMEASVACSSSTAAKTSEPSDTECEEETSATAGDLARTLAPALQKWSALCYVSEHLDTVYNAIGSAERQWLTEEVMTDGNDVEVEGLVRQTFRRDLSVPTTGLALLWEDYDAFEVDERKRTDMEKRRKASANSEWMRNARLLAERLAERTSVDSEANGLLLGGNDATDSCADVLVRSWGSSSARDAMRALAFTMQRLVEWESFPGVLNPSRLEFALHLLRSWFTHYSKDEHRWSSSDPFVAQDDSDLWTFVLERLTVLLQWSLQSALVAAKDTPSTLTAWSAAVERQFEAVQCVSVSTLSCFETYRHNILRSHATPEKKEHRVRTARRLVSQWVRDVLIRRFGAALLADLQRNVPEQQQQDAAGHTSDDVLLLLESALKLTLSHAQLGVAEADDVTAVQERLEALINDLLDTTTVLHTAPLQRITLRLLNMYASTLDGFRASADDSDPDPRTAKPQAWRKVCQWFRALLLASTADATKHEASVLFVNDLTDAWMHNCRKASACFAEEKGAFESGIVDVSYERRRALKRLGV